MRVIGRKKKREEQKMRLCASVHDAGNKWRRARAQKKEEHPPTEAMERKICFGVENASKKERKGRETAPKDELLAFTLSGRFKERLMGRLSVSRD